MRNSLQTPAAESTVLTSTEQLKAAWLNSERVEFGDPALARVPLPLRKTYYPLGFPLVLSTNRTEVQEAATESWGSFHQLFDAEPLQLKVGVTSTDSDVCPPTPVCRVRDHVCTNIADGENFAISDHLLGYSLVWITTATLAHRDYFRYFFLESSAMSGIASRYATGIHAACVSLRGAGILLCGDSGAGKTTMSYACARAGWTYVTDDASYLVHGRDDRLIAGNCSQVRFRPTAAELFAELRGRGIMERAGVGKPSMEMNTGESSRVSTSSTANVKHIVFLTRNASTQNLVVFPTGAARLYMLQRAYSMPYGKLSQGEAIDHLLRVGVLELRYNDLDWAVERLELLAKKGC